MLNEMIQSQQRLVSRLEQSLNYTTLCADLKQSDRCFESALRQKSPAYIFECKRSSPSLGVIKADYQIPEIVKQYSEFASCISVLTNTAYFGGSLHDLRLASQATDKPILCKDIIINPYQVALARFYGADAVLLMLSVLDDADYQACEQIAQSYNMAVITEVHSLQELQRAKYLNASIIGINHRCLNTLEIDHNRVLALAAHLPKSRLIIAESGIHSHQQIQQLIPFVDGFLIGGSLMQSKQLAFKMRELLFGTIKVCGLTRSEDAQSAYHAGATYGGLIFVENSLRKITLDLAQSIVKSAPLRYVGVFANQALNLIYETAKLLKLHAVQLHGSESEQYIADLRKILPLYCQIWKAYPGNGTLPSQRSKFVDKLVIDSMHDTQLGGTGQCFNWNVLKNSPLLAHAFLAGGLNETNIQQALKLNCYGLDLNSGIESSPGLKCATKIQRVLNTIRLQGALS